LLGATVGIRAGTMGSRVAPPSAAIPSAVPRLRTTLATLAIVLAALGFGSVAFFARSLADAGIASPVIALFRFGFVALVLLPVGLAARGKGRPVLWALGAGFAMGIGWTGYVAAIKVAPVASAGVVYMSYPVFALLSAWVLLGQRPALRSLAAAALILGAAVLALGPSRLPAEAVWALLVSFAAPVTFGTSIAILTGKLAALTPLERVFFAAQGATVGLLPMLAGVEADALLPETVDGWALIAGIAVLTALLPQLLYVIAAPAIGAARTAMAGSVELPTMFVIGWLAFGEPLSLAQLAAGAAVLVAVVLTPPLAPPAALAPSVTGDDRTGDPP